jgi:hypothetical protein
MDTCLREEEIHRYFPEWADLPPLTAPLMESDCNSYLAGGYADEFGYHLQPDVSTGARIIDGPLEHCSYLRVQIGALHPGYPECPRPVARYFESAPLHWSSSGSVREQREVTFKAVTVRQQGRAGWPGRQWHSATALISRWKELRIRYRTLGRPF